MAKIPRRYIIRLVTPLHSQSILVLFHFQFTAGNTILPAVYRPNQRLFPN
jgi:hypothetical protein